jgi:hypothetical protein
MKSETFALLGADHVFDSRSLSFADDVLAASSGEVDVVLTRWQVKPCGAVLMYSNHLVVS